MSNLIKIGTCKSPHGIKGAANFHLEHELGQELSKGDELKLFPLSCGSSLKEAGEHYKIKKITFGHKVMLELEGISNRSQLEEMLPFEIKIPRPVMEEGEYLLEDLIGFEVVNMENNEVVGEVAGYYDNGVQQILEIKGEVEIDLPLIEQFFPKIDFDKNQIQMNIPDFIEVTEK